MNLLSLLAILAGSDAFSIQQTLFNENILAKASAALNVPLGSIPSEVKSLWSEMALHFPQTATNLQFWSAPKPATRKLDAWDAHVTDAEKAPNHVLRVKSVPASLGIDTVKQYSGYLDSNEDDKHFFYYFFESRNDPENDPVVLWLNGGPGCSSLTGLFFELGPSSIGKDIKPIYNDFSWNSNASIIFLDQPVNVGFSYSSGSVSNTVAAGKDVYAFLELFFAHFNQFRKNEFHIAGESYAGHYIPVFAEEILSHTERGFNLTSVLIGNGLTDPLTQYEYYRPMACGDGGADAVLNDDECANMDSTQGRCLSLIESCYQSQSVWSCVPAAIYCNNAQLGPYQRTGRNVYDVREDCEGGSLCYTGLDYIDKYLNQPAVMEALGAETDSYQSCNFDINRNFLFAGDWMKPYHRSVTKLLDAGLPVLIYAGDKDFICNWLGNEGWTNVLPWSGSEGFTDADVKTWKVNGRAAGKVKNYENLTFLRVYEAGHMVPYNQPENSLDFFNSWIGGNMGIKK